MAGAGIVAIIDTLYVPLVVLFASTWRPSSAWKVIVPATLLGPYLALTLWIAGMKYILASVAGILGQSSTLWILVFSVLFLHERSSRRKALAAMLALAGVLPGAGRPDAGGTACSHASRPPCRWHGRLRARE